MRGRAGDGRPVVVVAESLRRSRGRQRGGHCRAPNLELDTATSSVGGGHLPVRDSAAAVVVVGGLARIVAVSDLLGVPYHVRQQGVEKPEGMLARTGLGMARPVLVVEAGLVGAFAIALGARGRDGAHTLAVCLEGRVRAGVPLGAGGAAQRVLWQHRGRVLPARRGRLPRVGETQEALRLQVLAHQLCPELLCEVLTAIGKDRCCGEGGMTCCGLLLLLLLLCLVRKRAVLLRV